MTRLLRVRVPDEVFDRIESLAAHTSTTVAEYARSVLINSLAELPVQSLAPDPNDHEHWGSVLTWIASYEGSIAMRDYSGPTDAAGNPAARAAVMEYAFENGWTL